MRVTLLGPPGSGKTALAALIHKDFDLPVVTVSDVLARCATHDSVLGTQVAQYLKLGQCVPDALVQLAMHERLLADDVAAGFVLEGYPLTVAQAEEFNRFLKQRGQQLDIVVHIKVDSDVLMERLVGRAHCDSCGADYNLYVNPPMVEGVCDECGARIVQRPGDYEETISSRLRIFGGLIGPLLQYYKVYGLLFEIDGDGEPDVVYRQLRPELVRADEQAAARVEEIAAVESFCASPAVAVSASGEKATKKTAAKKTTAKKATAKKATAKKAAAKKASAKKTAAKKTSAKKTSAKKTSAKKASAKKASAKKAAAVRSNKAS